MQYYRCQLKADLSGVTDSLYLHIVVIAIIIIIIYITAFQLVKHVLGLSYLILPHSL